MEPAGSGIDHAASPNSCSSATGDRSSPSPCESTSNSPIDQKAVASQTYSRARFLEDPPSAQQASGGDTDGSGESHADEEVSTNSRETAMLAPEPLHPLQQHPLGGGRGPRHRTARRAAWTHDAASSTATPYSCESEVAVAVETSQAWRSFETAMPLVTSGGARPCASSSEPSCSVAGALDGIVNQLSTQTRYTPKHGMVNRGAQGLFEALLSQLEPLLASHPDPGTQASTIQGLSHTLLDLHAAVVAVERKEDECENLRGVLRELAATRAEAIQLKAQMADSFNGLQAEYYKAMRSAQLAQAACAQHAARSAAARKQAAEAEAEAGRFRRAFAAVRERNRQLREANGDMAERLQALERLALSADGRHSVCYSTLLQAQSSVLY